MIVRHGRIQMKLVEKLALTPLPPTHLRRRLPQNDGITITDKPQEEFCNTIPSEPVVLVKLDDGRKVPEAVGVKGPKHFRQRHGNPVSDFGSRPIAGALRLPI